MQLDFVPSHSSPNYQSHLGQIIFFYLQKNVFEFFNFNFYLFIKVYLLFIFREWEHTKEGGGRGVGRENLKKAPHCQRIAQCGARTHEPWDHYLSPNQESNSQPTEPPRHSNFHFLKYFLHIYFYIQICFPYFHQS